MFAENRQSAQGVWRIIIPVGDSINLLPANNLLPFGAIIFNPLFQRHAAIRLVGITRFVSIRIKG